MALGKLRRTKRRQTTVIPDGILEIEDKEIRGTKRTIPDGTLDIRENGIRGTKRSKTPDEILEIGGKGIRGTKRSKTADEVLEIPDEILEMLLLRLDSILDVVSFSLTSSKWYHLVHSTLFWQLQPACGKKFIIFCFCFDQVLWRCFLPSSSWRKAEFDAMEMFNLSLEKGDMNSDAVPIRVNDSNGMLCIFQSLAEFYIVDPLAVDVSLKQQTLSMRNIPRRRKEKLFFDFDPLSNKYNVLLYSSNCFSYYRSAERERRWRWYAITKPEGVISESFMLLGPFFYFLKRPKEEPDNLELWAYDLSIRRFVHKKATFIELEGSSRKTSINESSTFFLFKNKRKLMLLEASSVMLQVWSVHEERDEYILKLHSAFQLDEEHKGCKISSTSDLVILQFCGPSSLLAYCRSTSEWQWIDGLHYGIGFGATPSFYALEVSKVFPNFFGHRMGMARG